MNRQDLINRLVARKVSSTERLKAMCICMARALCWGGGTRPRPAVRKS
jgi:hypothetical protein